MRRLAPLLVALALLGACRGSGGGRPSTSSAPATTTTAAPVTATTIDDPVADRAGAVAVLRVLAGAINIDGQPGLTPEQVTCFSEKAADLLGPKHVLRLGNPLLLGTPGDTPTAQDRATIESTLRGCGGGEAAVQRLLSVFR